jgi:(R)-citramalate synthase
VSLWSDPGPAALEGRRVEFIDTTLRDGEQTPGVAFSAEQKLEITRLLDQVGVPVISVGYPAVSEQERDCVRRIADEKRAGRLKARLSVIARPLDSDLEHAAACGVGAVSLVLPSSDALLAAKLGPEGRAGARRLLEAGAAKARALGLEFTVAAEDSTRADRAFLRELFLRAADLGAEAFMVCDTVGLMTPERLHALVSSLAAERRPVKIAMHCHDDYGLATINTVAGILAGADQASVTFDGLGERAGNAALDEVSLVLMHHYGARLGLRTELFARAAELVARHSGAPRDAFKPVTGRNAFRHESGLHVAALLKDPLSYQPFPPETVGRRTEFVLGKHSGRALLRKLLGPQASEEQVAEAARRLKELAPAGGAPLESLRALLGEEAA